MNFEQALKIVTVGKPFIKELLHSKISEVYEVYGVTKSKYTVTFNPYRYFSIAREFDRGTYLNVVGEVEVDLTEVNSTAKFYIALNGVRVIEVINDDMHDIIPYVFDSTENSYKYEYLSSVDIDEDENGGLVTKENRESVVFPVDIYGLELSDEEYSKVVSTFSTLLSYSV